MMKNNKKKVGITAFALVAILGFSVYSTVMAADNLNKVNAKNAVSSDFYRSYEATNGRTISLDDIHSVGTEASATSPKDVKIKNIVLTEVPSDTPQDIELSNITITPSQWVDNGDGSVKFKTEDGEEFTFDFSENDGEFASKIKDGELKLQLNVNSEAQPQK